MTNKRPFLKNNPQTPEKHAKIRRSLDIGLSLASLAWVAGTVTVGAPGGLGVREAVITLNLTLYTGEAEADFLI